MTMATTWAFIILAVGSLSAINAYEHVCSRDVPVTYDQSVLKSRYVSYTQHHWWYGAQIRYRPEHYWTTETKSRKDIKYFCCDGYEGSINNCRPICWNECPGNRYCSAPRTCDCKPGFEGDECQPICDNCGKFEYCQEPGKCACNKGYKRINDIGDCIPECSNGCSEHSFCSEPEICQCEVDYAKTNDSDICLPVCKSACGENSSCKEPNLCTCNEGYEDMGNGKCQPACHPGCAEHSQCTSPGKCECLEGYSIRGNTNDTSCQPVCTNGCPTHSSCKEPNSCECDSGYIKVEEICQPHCPNKCPDYAQCTAPNVCECFPGYEESEENHKCQPKCDQGCPLHALCTNPDTCRCKIGYLMSPNNTCEPHCSRDCLNGMCSEPEICVCNKGYKFKENSLNICDPLCKNDCINGDCLGPDFCACHVGYKPNDFGGCMPSCELECLNGNCTGPDECTCLDGFEMTEISNRCKPKCSQGCESGECIAPEVCQCSMGYKQIPEGCELDTTTSELTSTSTETVFETSSTLANDYTTLDDSLLNCTTECQCWSKLNELGTLSTGKCEKTCLDDHDQPCLDLTLCRCNPSNSSIICRESKDENISETDEMEFTCTIRIPHGESLKIDSKTQATSSSYWLPILGILSGIIIISGILGAITYRKRKITHITDPVYDDVL